MWLLGLFCTLHLQHLFRNSVSIIFVFIIIIIIPHCVSKNVPPLTLTCYNLYIHGLTATIFGKNVAEKVDNQNVLYFPTSPKYCFYTTWGNKKPRNCVFSFKCCMSFYQKTQNTVKNITWSELNNPSLLKRSTGYTRQDLGREHSILLCVTHMLCVNQVCHSVSRCVKDESCSSSSLSESQWTVLIGYLTISTNVKRYQTHHRWQLFNFFFQEDSVQVHYVCNTIQLSENVIFVFPHFSR